MLRLFLLLVLFTFLGSVTVSHADGPASRDVQILHSDRSGVTLLLTAPDPAWRADKVNGVACLRPVDAGVQSFLLGAPPRATASVEVIPLTAKPLAAPQCAALETSSDQSQADRLPARIIDLGMMRSQHILRLEVRPLQTDESGQAVYYQTMRIRVRFDGDRSGQAIPEPSSFEAMFRDLLVNYDTARSLRSAQAEPPRTNPWNLSTPAWRVLVDAPGIYELSYQDLRDAGLPVDALDPHTLRMFNFGKEIAIAVTGEADSRLDPVDKVLFYGEPVNTRYTTTNVYWLTYGGANGRRINERTSASDASMATTYRASLLKETNRYYVSSLPMTSDHDHWFGERLDAYGANAVRFLDYSFEMSALPAGSHQAQLSVLLGGNVNANHHVRLIVNGQLVEDTNWSGRTIYQNSITFPQSYLHDGQNTVRVELHNDTPGQAIDQIYIDWLRLDYERTLVAENDLLTFAAEDSNAHTYQVDGFSANDLELYDISAPDRVQRITNWQAIATGDGHYRLRFSDTAGTTRRYLAQTQNQRLHPVAIERKESSKRPLTSVENGADYIIIYHPDFGDAIKPLITHRQAQGLRVMAVSTQAIYDDFGYGMMSAEAIHDFLAYAYHHWQAPAPTYVLLVGDGTYDMRHYLTDSADTYVPPYLAMVDPTLGETAADNRFVTISEGDILPDMHIGRLPANTSAEAAAMVAKILAYEQWTPDDDWTHNTLFVTDNLEGGGGNFYELSDAIADGYVDPPANTTKLIPDDYRRKKLYLDRTCTSGANCRQGISDTLNNEGALFVSYIGHGTKTFWAREHLWDVAAASSLHNGNKMPIMLPMTCNEGYFHEAAQGEESTSEAAVRLPGNGAIASWAPTGYGLSSGHDYLERGLFLAIFHSSQQQMGPATTAGKLYLAANSPSDSYFDLIDTFLLLGDPALSLPVASPAFSQQIYLPLIKE